MCFVVWKNRKRSPTTKPAVGGRLFKIFFLQDQESTQSNHTHTHIENAQGSHWLASYKTLPKPVALTQLCAIKRTSTRKTSRAFTRMRATTCNCHQAKCKVHAGPAVCKRRRNFTNLWARQLPFGFLPFAYFVLLIRPTSDAEWERKGSFPSALIVCVFFLLLLSFRVCVATFEHCN